MTEPASSLAGGTLDGIELFKALGPDDRTRIAMRCRWRRYTAHQQIVGHQDEADDVFFIASGKVRVTLYASSGREVMFRDLAAGEMFGEFAAIDGQPRSATVMSLGEAVIASMTGAAFRHLLQEHPAVAATLLKRLTFQIRDLTERVFEFSTLAVRSRIHAELLRLARPHRRAGGSAAITPMPTHAEIASRVSTHREAVARELASLARAGLVERRRGCLIVHDVAALAHLVQEACGD